VTRFVSTTNQTEATKAAIVGFVAVDLDFTSGHVRAHDGIGSLIWGGNTYLGVGNFGSIEVVEEAIEVVAKAVKLSLSGVETSLLTTATTEVYQGRSATIYLGFLDRDTNALLATPETLWEGRMDTMTVQLGPQTGSLSVNCEPRLRREPRIARYTNEDQQLAYPGDRFFDLIGKIPGFQGTWGAKGVANDLSGYQPSGIPGPYSRGNMPGRNP
jgi:hypothetical protein